MSVGIFLLLILGVGIQSYQDLSQPGAWDYWKDLYLSPSMRSSLVDNADLGGQTRQRAGPCNDGREASFRNARGERCVGQAE